jgi:hypothetical protein
LTENSIRQRMSDIAKALRDVFEADKRRFEEEEKCFERIKRLRESEDGKQIVEMLKSGTINRLEVSEPIKLLLDKLEEGPLTCEQLVEKAWDKRESAAITITESGRVCIHRWFPGSIKGYEMSLRTSQNVFMELQHFSGLDNHLISSEFLKRFGELATAYASGHVQLGLLEDDQDYPVLTDDWLCTLQGRFVDYHRGELLVHLVIHGVNGVRGDKVVEEHDTWSAVITLPNVSSTVKELKELVEEARDAGRLIFKNCENFFQGLDDSFDRDDDEEVEEEMPLVFLPKVLDFVEFHPDTPTTEEGVTEWDKALKDFGNANRFVWETPGDDCTLLLNFHCYVVDGHLHPLM